MIFRFFRSASSMSSSACGDVEVNGFSTNTCLPFSSAAFASSKCVQTGVIDRDRVDVRRLQDVGEIGGQLHARIERAARAAARPGSRSQTATTSQCSRPCKLLTMLGPQYP